MQALPARFAQAMSVLEGLRPFSPARVFAVALSGGPDSMALCGLLAGWAKEHGFKIHAVTIDHALRSESAEEAVRVGEMLSQLPGLAHHILRWTHDGMDNRIQERAREARYQLLCDFCREQGISELFAAHHGDDQAETLLFRLAKGSGPDGLSAMAPVQEIGEGVALYRPLLDFEKAELVAYCDEQGFDYVRDPSNENERFARVRLRAGREVLKNEGLSTKRLVKLASRMRRVREALEDISDRAFLKCVTIESKRIEIDIKELEKWPEEIAFRVFIRALDAVSPSSEIQGYGVRMTRLEDLFSAFWRGKKTFRRTLGGAIVTFKPDAQRVILTPERG